MRNKSPLVFIVLAYFFFDVVFIEGLPKIKFSNINVYILDIISVLLILVILLKLVRTKFSISKMDVPTFILGALLLVSTVRGILLFGVEPAVNSLREYLYFYTILLTVIVLGRQVITLKKLIYFWGIVSWLIFIIVLVRWSLVAMDLAQNPSWVAAGGGMVRVINAAQTLFLLYSVIFALSSPKGIKLMPLQRVLPWVFIPVIVVLQHRTIWVILLFVLVWFAIQTKKVWIYLPLLVFGFVFVFVVILSLLGDNTIFQSITGSAQNIHTLIWRMDGWKQLLSIERYQSVLDYGLGQPFGTGYMRYLYDSSNYSYLVDVSPHNFYVQTFLNIGVLGLITLLVIYFWPITILMKNQKYTACKPFLLVLVSQLVFFLAYSPKYQDGLLLGMAILICKELNYRSSH